MPKPPLTISFPVLPEIRPYAIGVEGPLILLSMAPVAPAHALRDPNPHCNVVGQMADGRKVQIMIPLRDWQRALKTPVVFVEALYGGLSAAPGVLLDRNGQPIRKELEPLTKQDRKSVV